MRVLSFLFPQLTPEEWKRFAHVGNQVMWKNYEKYQLIWIPAQSHHKEGYDTMLGRPSQNASFSQEG